MVQAGDTWTMDDHRLLDVSALWLGSHVSRGRFVFKPPK